MAKFIKTRNDLASYNITINQVDALTFFGLPELPPPSVDNELLTIADYGGMQKADNAQLIFMVDYITTPGSLGDPVLDFSVELFNVLGYHYGSRLARRRVGLNYFICGAKRRTTANVCIFDAVQNEFLLVVQEDKMAVRRDPFGPQVQLVVKAVAAFHMNNANREAAGCPPLAEMVMPGIVLAGTSPSFFKIPITQNLLTHIANGTCPQEETHVTFYPALTDHSGGMKPLDNRREIFRCYEAFKAIVGIKDFDSFVKDTKP